MTDPRYPGWTDEERAIIVRCRARFAYIDSLTEPQRSLAIAGAPESQWPALLHWISQTVEEIRKTRAVRPGSKTLKRGKSTDG